jgi:hypothetical protein
MLQWLVAIEIDVLVRMCGFAMKIKLEVAVVLL